MYLISYDISSDKTRRKISKILENYGKRIQYSVFECNIEEKRFKKLYGELAREAVCLEDGSIRFYFLCANCIPKMLLLGKDKPSNYRDKEDVIIV